MRYGVLTLALMIACQPRGAQNTDGLDGGDDPEGDADTDADSDTDTDTDADTDVSGCDAIDQEGLWADHSISAAGTTLTYDPYTFDAGVAPVRTAAEGATSGRQIVDLPVSGAVVVARGYVPAGATTTDLWFADASGAMFGYDLDLGGLDTSTIEPGDVVSFQATEVQSFYGIAELTAVTGFTVDSKGSPVHVTQVTDGTALDYAVHGEQVVEVWGGLVSGPDNNIFDFQYAGGTIDFRTFSAYDQAGDCIHWIGPLTSFSSVEQLNADDFDWYRNY